jgi:hypothetical protein
VPDAYESGMIGVVQILDPNVPRCAR